VLACDQVEIRPWRDHQRGVNSWNEPKDKSFTIEGHRDGAKYLASFLLNHGFDIPYSYRPLHEKLGHAFANTVLFLDWDRRGFPYPLVPFTTNAYGRYLTASNGVPPTPSGTESDMPATRSIGAGPGVVSSRRSPAQSVYRLALARGADRVVELVALFLTEKHGRIRCRSDRRYLSAANRPMEIWKSTQWPPPKRAGIELINWFASPGRWRAQTQAG
jgi:hypothetical protein